MDHGAQLGATPGSHESTGVVNRNRGCGSAVPVAADGSARHCHARTWQFRESNPGTEGVLALASKGRDIGSARMWGAVPNLLSVPFQIAPLLVLVSNDHQHVALPVRVF